MNLLLVSQILALAALVFTLAAFGLRLRAFNLLARPVDRSATKGNVQSGVVYAFTLGMMPWAKEGTRIHWIAYTRGVVFHIMIFIGLAIFLFSPWINNLPVGWISTLAVLAGIGALLGIAGFIMRLVEHNLKALSTLDDYFAVLLVSLFLASAAIWLSGLSGVWFFYLMTGIMLVYAPLGKIRHCIYYAYSRLFFGKFTGRRAVLPHSQQNSGRVS